MTDRVEGDALSRQFGCLGHWSFGTPHSCGVGILFHSRLTVTDLFSSHDDHGRMVWVDFEFRSQRFRFVNVYAANEGRERVLFFNYVYTLHSNRVTVLGGDFNCVEDLGLDKAGGGGNVPRPSTLGLGTLIPCITARVFWSVGPTKWSTPACRSTPSYCLRSLLLARRLRTCWEVSHRWTVTSVKCVPRR